MSHITEAYVKKYAHVGCNRINEYFINEPRKTLT